MASKLRKRYGPQFPLAPQASARSDKMALRVNETQRKQGPILNTRPHPTTPIDPLRFDRFRFFFR